MTAVICWVNKECDHEVLWCISDSRISNIGKISDKVYTNRSPKIFTIPVSIRKRLDSESNTIYSVGLAYAGSSVIGLAVKEIFSRCLKNLVESRFEGDTPLSASVYIPSIEKIAELLRSVSIPYISEMGQTSPDSTGIEFLLFGFCPVKRSYVAYYLIHSLSNPNVISVNEKPLNNNEIVFLGSNREQLFEKIELIRGNLPDTSIEWNRAPLTVLRDVISQSNFQGVGGYTQLALCLPIGITEFQHYDFQDGQPNYFGFDIERDLTTLGGYEIQFPGLAWPNQ